MWYYLGMNEVQDLLTPKHFWQVTSLFVALLTIPVSVAFIQRGTDLRSSAAETNTVSLENISTKAVTLDYTTQLGDENKDGLVDIRDYATFFPEE